MVSWSLSYLTFVIGVIDFFFTANFDIFISISISNPINLNEIDAKFDVFVSNPKNEKIDENFYRRNLGEGVVLHRRDNYLDINK